MTDILDYGIEEQLEMENIYQQLADDPVRVVKYILHDVFWHLEQGKEELLWDYVYEMWEALRDQLQ